MNLDVCVQEILVFKTKSFNTPIKKLNLKTFASVAKAVKITGQSKRAKQKCFWSACPFGTKTSNQYGEGIDFPLRSCALVPSDCRWSPCKDRQVKSDAFLEGKSHTVQRPAQGISCYVIDGNAILQAQVALPNTFGELVESVFDQLPEVPRVDFITNSYWQLSIKMSERNRRGPSKPLLIKGA